MTIVSKYLLEFIWGCWGTESIEIAATLAGTNMNTLRRGIGIGEQKFEKPWRLWE